MKTCKYLPEIAEIAPVPEDEIAPEDTGGDTGGASGSAAEVRPGGVKTEGISEGVRVARQLRVAKATADTAKQAEAEKQKTEQALFSIMRNYKKV